MPRPLVQAEPIPREVSVPLHQLVPYPRQMTPPYPDPSGGQVVIRGSDCDYPIPANIAAHFSDEFYHRLNHPPPSWIPGEALYWQASRYHPMVLRFFVEWIHAASYDVLHDFEPQREGLLNSSVCFAVLADAWILGCDMKCAEFRDEILSLLTRRTWGRWGPLRIKDLITAWKVADLPGQTMNDFRRRALAFFLRRSFRENWNDEEDIDIREAPRDLSIEINRSLFNAFRGLRETMDEDFFD